MKIIWPGGFARPVFCSASVRFAIHWFDPRRPFGLAAGTNNNLARDTAMIMRFGLYAEMQAPPPKPHPDLYRELMGQMEHADRVGFDVYSVIEHHFFPDFSM